MFTKDLPLFKVGHVLRALPQAASQAKKHTLGCTFECQMMFAGKENRGAGCSTLKRD